MIRVAIDAMGGDFGPEPIIEGVVQALEEKKFLPILVGDRAQILSLLPQYYHDKVEIEHTTDVIEMKDSSTDVRKRKYSTIFVACTLVKEKKADAVVSAGHSGATLASATLAIGRLPHINRAALATLMPSLGATKTLVLDVGAVVECKPQNLYEFAMMGEAYAKSIMKLNNPRVGLLANGEEENKGNDLTKETFGMLKGYEWFVGNVEGRDIFNGSVDVVVCDGFTGNILLKTSEGVARTITELIKQYVRKSLPATIGALLMKKNVFANLKKEIDYAEYGGAPLLGINGCVIVSHGSSNAKAIKNAIFQAINYCDSNVNNTIELLLTHKIDK